MNSRSVNKFTAGTVRIGASPQACALVDRAPSAEVYDRFSRASGATAAVGIVEILEKGGETARLLRPVLSQHEVVRHSRRAPTFAGAEKMPLPHRAAPVKGGGKATLRCEGELLPNKVRDKVRRLPCDGYGAFPPEEAGERI